MLSLGGMLSLDARDTTVITVFSGEPEVPVVTQYDQSCNFMDSRQAMATRREENRRALEFFGVEVMDLGYTDIQYEEPAANILGTWIPTNTWMNNVTDFGVAATMQTRDERRLKRKKDLRKRLSAQITSILDSYIREKGPHIEVFSSLGESVSDHADHEILYLAIMDVAFSFRLNPEIKWLFYEDFPYVLRIATRNYANFRKAEWMQSYLRKPIEAPEGWITQNIAVFSPRQFAFDRCHYERKKEAIDMYASQVKHHAASM